MDDDLDPTVPVVRVLGDVSVHYGGRRMPLPAGCHRLLAYLALHPDGVEPARAAAALWPDADDDRAAASLRSAVWRLHLLGCPLLRADREPLGLRDDVVVDLAALEAWASRVVSGGATPDDLLADPDDGAGRELLPGWSEAWVLAARDRLHRQVLSAQERMRAARPAPAVQAVHGTPDGPVRQSGPPGGVVPPRAARHRAVRRGPHGGVRRLLGRSLRLQTVGS